MANKGRRKVGLYIELEEKDILAMRELADKNGRTITAEMAHAVQRHCASPPKIVTSIYVPEMPDTPLVETIRKRIVRKVSDELGKMETAT